MNVFEMIASAIKSLMSGAYITIKKANFRHIHYIILTSFLLIVVLLSLSSFGILSHTFFFFPRWGCPVPPERDTRDTVSIIGVVLIEITNNNYNGDNGHGESYQGGQVLSRMRWEESERDLGHSVFPEAQPGEKRGSPHQCTMGKVGLGW